MELDRRRHRGGGRQPRAYSDPGDAGAAPRSIGATVSGGAEGGGGSVGVRGSGKGSDIRGVGGEDGGGGGGGGEAGDDDGDRCSAMVVRSLKVARTRERKFKR